MRDLRSMARYEIVFASKTVDTFSVVFEADIETT